MCGLYAHVMRTTMLKICYLFCRNVKIISYLCGIENPWAYAGIVSTTISIPEGKEPAVELFGRRLPADAAVVRRCLAEEGTPPERQVELWMELWHQWPDPIWGEVCLAEAERVASLLKRETALRSLALNASTVIGDEDTHCDRMSVTDTPIHFVWLGDRRGVLVDHLRDGIAALAAAGLVAPDRQDDLRRAFGLTVNEVERRTPVAPVPWLGPVDMLWLLVDTLWELNIITCAGGRQQKWRTATSVFRRADGTSFGLTLKNSRCTNAAKRDLMERAILGGLRRLVAASS